MREAAELLLGDHNLPNYLGTLSQYPYLLMTFIVSDAVGTTTQDFAAAYMRAYNAAKIGAGPPVQDGWLCKSEAGTVGFIRVSKPHTTAAEYLAPVGSDGYALMQQEDELAKRVMVTAPLARELLTKIAKSGLDCWPSPALNPSGVGLFVDPNGLPIRAVVTDWAVCLNDKLIPERLFETFLRNYKRLLAEIPVEVAGDAGLSFHQERFMRATGQKLPPVF
jgi:hypothetical protein